VPTECRNFTSINLYKTLTYFLLLRLNVFTFRDLGTLNTKMGMRKLHFLQIPRESNSGKLYMPYTLYM